MADKRDDWVERLIDVEPADRARRETLQQEIRAVIEQKLSPARRWLSLISGIFFIVLAIGSGTAVLRDRRADPMLIRTCAVVAAALCLLFGVILIRMAKRGIFDRLKHNQIFMLLSVVTLGSLSLVFLNSGWSSGDPQLVFTGEFMLALLGLILILHLAERFQFWVRQKVLEFEFRLADIAEKLDRRNDPKR